MQISEFLVGARLDVASLEAWLAAGWLAPEAEVGGPEFSEIDVARALLIHDLRHMGVNDEGVPVILDLVDQLHGLRRLLRDVIVLAAEPDRVWPPAGGWDDGDPGRRRSAPPGS
jgi:chaperone modulatory protein CbpM